MICFLLHYPTQPCSHLNCHPPTRQVTPLEYRLLQFMEYCTFICVSLLKNYILELLSFEFRPGTFILTELYQFMIYHEAPSY